MRISIIKRLSAWLILTFSQTVSAEVYKWVDSDGSVHFGDIPPKADVQPHETSLQKLERIRKANSNLPKASTPINPWAQEDLAAAITRYVRTESAANKGDIESIYHLALLYAFGHGVEQDVSKSLELLSNPALSGIGQVQAMRLIIYLGGFGESFIDADQAKNAAYAGAELNDPYAVQTSYFLLSHDALQAAIEHGSSSPEKALPYFDEAKQMFLKIDDDKRVQLQEMQDILDERSGKLRSRLAKNASMDNARHRTKKQTARSKAGAIPSTPIERRASIANVSESQINALASIVRGYGYRCDSVSAATPFLLSDGFNLTCNSSRYKYEIEDKGGRWFVKVD